MPPPLLSRLHAHRAALCVLSHLVAFVAVILGFALTALFRSQVPILIAGLFAFAAFVWRWGLFLIVLWYGTGWSPTARVYRGFAILDCMAP
jgi:hypothetical protein